MTTSTTPPNWTAMSGSQREQFERDGYLIIPGVLSPDELAYYQEAVDRVFENARRSGRLAADNSLHLLGAVANCPELAGLMDHPTVFPYVWSMLGWNVHVYHSHIDVHPRITGPKPFRWQWHQDGGRQNREIEVDPRPRLSVKLAFWLSDVSETGRGNFTILPGSHLTNWLPGPPRRSAVPWPQPEGAIEVTVNAGDVVFFDRRLWHARSDNHSPITRKGVFFAYTYRWITIRDDVAGLPLMPWWKNLNPVQKQLLGCLSDGTGDHSWGHYPKTTPLYGELADRGLLDQSYPPLIP